MIREDWKVQKPAKELLDAAVFKTGFHEGRITFWRGKKDELIVKLKSEGINVTESLVEEMGKASYISTRAYGHNGPNVQIDQGMLAQINEAQGKVTKHEELLSEYRTWSEMLKDTNKTFELDYDDWKFFFGK